MAAIVGVSNPISWGQFQRQGGVKNTLSVSGAYLAIISLVIYVTVSLTARNQGMVYSGWCTGLLGLQTLFVVVIGSARIATMIRGDINSGIIESHRMMPLPAAHAVAGYLGAAAAQVSGFFLANILMGVVMTILAGLPVGRWVAANLILLSFAGFLWTLGAFAAFQPKKSGGALLASSMAGFMGNAGLLYVAPGLVVLVGPLIGGSIFNLRSAQTELTMPLVLSTCCQVLVGAIFFTGATRKYRRPDMLALGNWLGAVLLLTMVGISVLAIVRWEEFQPGFMRNAFRGNDELPYLPFLGSAILCMIVAVTPLTNFARQHTEWVGARVDEPGARQWVPSPLMSGIVVVGILALMMLAAPMKPGRREFTYTVAAFYGFSMSLVFLAAWVYRSRENAKVPAGIWLVCYCLVPIGVDLVRHGVGDDRQPTLGIASSISPIGLLIQTWNLSETDLRLGAAMQLVAPLLAMALFLQDAKKKAAGIPSLLPSGG